MHPDSEEVTRDLAPAVIATNRHKSKVLAYHYPPLTPLEHLHHTYYLPKTPTTFRRH